MARQNSKTTTVFPAKNGTGVPESNMMLTVTVSKHFFFDRYVLNRIHNAMFYAFYVTRSIHYTEKRSFRSPTNTYSARSQ